MKIHPKLSLVEHLKEIADPRVDRTKDHDLIDVLVIAVCTLLCAGESFNDMEDFGLAKQEWFKTFLSLRNGIPSHDTFNRVFAALDPKLFPDCFCVGRKVCARQFRRRLWLWMARPCAGRSAEIRV